MVIGACARLGHREEYFLGDGADDRQRRDGEVQGDGLQGLGNGGDRAGLPIVMLRGDGAGLHTPEGSDRKAYTARTFRAPSADFVQRMFNDPALGGQKEYTRVLALSGGLPIKVGDDVVGAVGVSGSPG